MEPDDLTLALLVLDLEASGTPASLAWLLERQDALAELEPMTREFKGAAGFVSRLAARAVGKRTVDLESQRIHAILTDAAGSRRLVEIRPGNPDRFSLVEETRTEALTLAAWTLEEWERLQAPDPEADAPGLLRYLASPGAQRIDLDDLARTYFAPWVSRPGDGAGLAALRARHETVRGRRLEALVAYLLQRGWIDLTGGTVGLTEPGRAEAAKLPEDWR